MLIHKETKILPQIILGLLCYICTFQTAYSQLVPKDPTKPFNFTNTQINNPKGIVIEGIFFRDPQSVVLIKGHYFAVGDKIMDAEITAINRDNIVLKDNFGTFTVSLSQSVIKSMVLKPSKKE